MPKHHHRSAVPESRPALVLALFGTTVKSGLKGLFGIEAALRKTFPQTPLAVAFTSNQVRHIWRKRAQDAAYRAEHPDIPEHLYTVRGPLAAIADLQDRGHGDIVVQPAHIVPAEEFQDLKNYVAALSGITTLKPHWRPFRKLVLGRPALGRYDLNHPYHEDIAAVVRALSGDLELARREGAALLYMGHGNPYFPAGGLYLEFAAAMRAAAPDVCTLIATVEGFPSLDEARAELVRQGCRRVILKPFLVTAGEHAMNDMAGEDEDSWRAVLQGDGFEVLPVLQGLGEIPAFAEIFVRHAAEAAHDAGLELA